jgi:hypothetical protein
LDLAFFGCFGLFVAAIIALVKGCAALETRK